MVFLAVALSACSHWRPAPEKQPARQQPSETPADTPPPSEETTSGANGENAQPSAANAAVPLCVPPEPKWKPKAKPKPKVVRTEAPPQLPTAPVVEETPAGGVVDAQVRAMPVSVMSILGKRVRGPKGDDMGRVVDVLADASGRVRVAIIDFGGFLGVGDRRIAVDWPLLRFNPDGNDPSLLLSVAPEKLKGAPEYKDNMRPQTLMEPSSPASAVAPPADAKK